MNNVFASAWKRNNNITNPSDHYINFQDRTTLQDHPCHLNNKELIQGCKRAVAYLPEIPAWHLLSILQPVYFIKCFYSKILKVKHK